MGFLSSPGFWKFVFGVIVALMIYMTGILSTLQEKLNSLVAGYTKRKSVTAGTNPFLKGMVA